MPVSPTACACSPRRLGEMSLSIDPTIVWTCMSTAVPICRTRYHNANVSGRELRPDPVAVSRPRGGRPHHPPAGGGAPPRHKYPPPNHPPKDEKRGPPLTHRFL